MSYHPKSLFLDTGEMRPSKTKSDLKKMMQVVSSKRTSVAARSIVIDGSALFWTVHWPSSGTVKDWANGILNAILKYLAIANVYLIFDRYRDFSPKGATREERTNSMKHNHHFKMNTPLPKQDAALKSTSNKVQLIELICEHIQNETKKNVFENKLIVTGGNEYPHEIYNQQIEKRTDLRTTQEEADVIIVQQVFAAINEGSNVGVICDDTDVFVLLVYFLHKFQVTNSVLMEATHGERTLIDINATVAKYKEVIPSLLPLHALTGCDSAETLCHRKEEGIKCPSEKQTISRLCFGYELIDRGSSRSSWPIYWLVLWC